MIKISGLISISNTNKSYKNLPEIKNFKTNKIETTYIDISYDASDMNGTIFRHYIYLNGVKTEITNRLSGSTPPHFCYRIEDLELGTLYEIQIEVTDGLDIARSDLLRVSTLSAFIYGVRIDEENSNPEKSVTYIEQSKGLSPATNMSLGGWSDKWPFNKIRIVGFLNGQVTKEIKLDNKKQYIDNTNVPRNVDVMVEIPKIYWSFKRNTSTQYDIRISDKKIDNSFVCSAHIYKNQEVDNIYIGAYLATIIKSGLALTTTGQLPRQQTFSVLKSMCEGIGERYHMLGFYQLSLLQILYIILFKNLNSQQALGMGRVTGGTAARSGFRDNNGLIYGTQLNDTTICFLGIENIYGNCIQYIDGIKIDNNYDVYVCKNSYSLNDESIWMNVGKIDSRDNDAFYLKNVCATNDLAFVQKGLKSGSSTTYYCDYSVFKKNTYLTFGGSANLEGVKAGIFSMRFEFGKDFNQALYSCRLMYV